jgi:hypothetical protein
VLHLAAAWLQSKVRRAMGGSWKEVMQVLMEGMVVQVVGSIVVLLLWDSIAKWRHRHTRAHPLLPLSLSSGDCLITRFESLSPVCHTEMWEVAYSCPTAALWKNFIISELCAKKSSKLSKDNLQQIRRDLFIYFIYVAKLMLWNLKGLEYFANLFLNERKIKSDCRNLSKDILFKL